MKASWYRLDGLAVAHIEALRAAMLSKPFTTDALTGFRIESARAQSLEGVYIEKTEFTERVEDPFGAVTEVKRVKYESVSFRLNRAFPQLEIIDAPRSVRGLIAEISRATKFGVSIEKPVVSIAAWVDALKTRIAELQVTKLIYTGVPVGTGVVAQIVVSGEHDVRKDAELFLGKRSSVLQKATVTGTFELEAIAADLFTNCKANITCGSPDEALEQVRLALAQASKLVR